MTPKLIIVGPYPPPYGGVSIYVQQLTGWLKHRGIPFTLKSVQGDGGSAENQFSPGLRSIFKHFWMMNGETICLETISTFMENPSLRTAIPWSILKVIRRFKWIKVVHDGTLPPRYLQFKWHHRLAVWITAHLADEFVAVNGSLAEWLKTELNIRKPIHCISSLLPLIDTDTETLPNELDQMLRQFDKVITSTGTFTENYGFVHTANAVERARRETKIELGLVLVDSAYEVDSTYRDSVLKERPWIIVQAGMRHPQWLQLLRQSRLVVRGTRAESYGLSKVEALWYGVPVISTRAGVTHGMILYDFGDVDALTEHIQNCLEYRNCAEDISRYADQYRLAAQDNLNQLLAIMGIQ